MADRTVKVTAVLVAQQYIAGLEAMKRKQRETTTDAKDQLGQQREAMTQVGTAAFAIGAVAASAVGLAISKFAEFDQAMSEVSASTHESAENMGLLREAALQAGADTVFSATEAANAINELAKAGVSTSDIIGGGLSGALSLASAGSLDVASAAEIAATAMTQFGLVGADVPHIADLLAAGAGKAQGSVEDLSAALNQGGLVASQAGFSIEETTGTLAAFAAAGLVGSDAGTSLKTAILALQNPSDKSRGIMEQYGISVYDAAGNMLSMSEIAGQLEQAFVGKTNAERDSALATIFGSDAVRAANVLYDKGADGIAEWTAKVDDAGYAAETAAMLLDNLSGDMEYLGGAIDTALIKTGSAGNDVLRAMVQAVTAAVDVYNDMPQPVQTAALAIGVVTAALALGTGALLVIVPKIAETRIALQTLGVTATSVTGKLKGVAAFAGGPLGLALAAAAVAVTVLFDAIKKGQATSGEFENALKRSASAAELLRLAAKSDGATKTLFGDYGDSLKNLPDLLDRAGVAQDQFLGALSLNFNELGAIDGLDRLGDELANLAGTDLPAAQAAFKGLADDYNLTAEQQAVLLDTMPEYRDALTAQATALGINVSSSDEAANSAALLELALGTTTAATETSAEASETAATNYLDQADAAAAVAEELDAFIEQLNELNGVNQSSVEANTAYLESLNGVKAAFEDNWIQKQKDDYLAANGSLDGYTETLDGFSVSLDQNSLVGAQNASTLADVAAKAQDAAKAQYEVDKTTMGAKAATDIYIGTLATSKQAMIDGAVAAGANKEEVSLLADEVYALPSQKQIDILADTANAVRTIQDFKNQYGTLSGTIIYRAQLPDLNGVESGSGRLGTFASGGYTGDGGKYVPAGIVHRGEWVSKQETVANPYNRAALEYMHSGGDIRGFGGYSSGGLVDPRSLAPMPAQYSSSYSYGGKTIAPVVSLGSGNTFYNSGPNEWAKEMTRKQSQALALYDN
jgi:TP901 family phage tail tape measure protein